MQYIPLHVISNYSLLQSGLVLSEYISESKKRGLSAVGISDFDHFYSFPAFNNAAQSANITPLFGITLQLHLGTFVLYIKNEQGYSDLLVLYEALSSDALSDELLKEKSDNLIVIAPSRTLPETPELLKEHTKRIALLVNDFYIGLEDESDERKSALRAFAAKYNYNVVAFPRIKYLKKADRLTLEIATAVKNSVILDQKEFRGTEYFIEEKRIATLFTADEIRATHDISKACRFNFNNLKKVRPLPSPYAGESVAVITKLTNERLAALNLDNDERYVARLREELSVINDLGFTNYFLIVSDYVRFAKANNIFVGYARGSAASSLVSYLLQITNIDPLEHNLLFERFLNKERLSMPDIDLDFEDYRRDEVTAYLRDKYGARNVGQIITFQVSQARAALRDVARVFSYDQKYVEALISALRGSNYSLRNAYRRVPAFKKLLSDAHMLEIVSNASKIEGFPRQKGVHAAGVIVSRDPLPTSLPVHIEGETLISQYEMHELEHQGFLKLDILGLTNLTTLHNIIRRVEELYGKKYDFYSVPFDTPKTYEIIRKGFTTNIFQLESPGMNRAISELQPENFADITALLALYRPGPMQYIKTYTERKHGREQVVYPDASVAAILRETYGIIIYQEQIMQIVQVLAGFTLAEADLFRRAISDKDEQSFAALESKFKAGAQKLGHSERVINKVFSDLVKFADYGFNKAHSVSYATLTLLLAYFKAHYPLAFYGETLTHVTSDTNKYSLIRRELSAQNIKLLPPSITKSNVTFTAENGALRLPFTAIKGLTRATSELIVTLRENNKFTNSAMFFYYASKTKLTQNDIFALIESGALDELHSNRAYLKNQYIQMLPFLDSDLFDENYFATYHFDEVHEDGVSRFLNETARLSFALSSNPLLALSKKRGVRQLKDVTKPHMKNMQLVAFLDDVRVISTKTNKQMAFLTLSDFTNTLEAVVFPETYTTLKTELFPGTIVFITGDTQHHNNRLNFVVNTLERYYYETE